MDRDEVSRPTVTTEATMLTGVIEALEGQDVTKCNIPNAFVQTELNERDLDGHRTIMKIRGPLVDMDSEYEKFVVMKEHEALLYVHVLKTLICGTGISNAILQETQEGISLDLDSK